MLHVVFVHIHDVATQFYAHWTFFACQVFDAFAVSVAGGTTWVTHDHGIIAFFHATDVDGQVMGGCEGFVGRVEISGFVTRVGVDAEHAEIAGMTGPTPVVGFATKFTYTFWGSTYQTNIAVYFVEHRKELVAVVERGDFYYVVVAFFAKGSYNRFFGFGDLRSYGFGASGFILVDGDTGQHLAGYVFNFTQKTDVEIGGALSLLVGGPETIFQDVVLVGRKFLNGSVTTVVVREKQSLFGDYFSGTEHAALLRHQTNDGVFHRGLVDGVDVFGRQFQSAGLHGILDLLQQRERPHAFIGPQLE